MACEHKDASGKKPPRPKNRARSKKRNAILALVGGGHNFGIAFGLATLGHLFIVVRKRSWFFCAFLIGGLLETAGYIARFVSCSDESALGPFIVQTICILVAPALFAASVYMILGRLILHLNAASISPISPRWLTKIFVGGDVASFLIQVFGSGMLSNAKTTSTGQTVILIGLIVQILFFGLFMVVTVVFHRRFVQAGMDLRREPQRRGQIGWKHIIYVLYLVSGLIFVRSVFRLVEYAQGHEGALLSNEVFLYIFDSVLMLGVMVVLLFYHPTKLLTGRKDDIAFESL
ncbi:unnamed protein product [Parascedosporium putredinis]|uniref:RTA1 like protein n=1 Tax=Parascedosporium putredinis TaxID=1442378 RepID=A0A9P1H3A3_9PEZI|nr:unnamed protein product [Parascedosporium putredinis]CAI7996795.1 unnamed protein product [Parascedosporium putredinis]